MAEVEQAQTPRKPMRKAWLLVAAIVAAPLAFGVYAMTDPAAERLLSVMIKYSNFLYLGAIFLVAAAWVLGKPLNSAQR